MSVLGFNGFLILYKSLLPVPRLQLHPLPQRLAAPERPLRSALQSMRVTPPLTPPSLYEVAVLGDHSGKLVGTWSCLETVGLLFTVRGNFFKELVAPLPSEQDGAQVWLGMRSPRFIYVGLVASRGSYLQQARNRCLHSETQIGNGETQGDAAKRIQIDPQYWPRVTDLELQQIGRKTKSVVIPLFEKLLSASDADHKLARLVIPKKCAEAFFPEITSPHGCPVKIQDTGGKEWGFHFCYWLNNGSKMYVLEGLKDYIGSMQWQAGDIVTFYRIEPEKKLVMGLRKTCASVPPYEVKGNVH
ncbi:hypothetical protein RHSIM_RhsimUnG0258800 [Rhododendron simsii]|uniref:TF-B3 domain-containing protein n=1 Tax=Rhododendron simsii TaxID=118357 RepID=A0A834FT01_RHOSS|nr:hypothetical protein RHSIM_RhsimUnG0258800 [Rhododendron simsii]